MLDRKHLTEVSSDCSAHRSPAPRLFSSYLTHMPKDSAHGWWRSYFLDHPGLATKNPSAFRGDKVKVYCCQCFNAHIASLKKEYLERDPPIHKDRPQLETECELVLNELSLKYSLYDYSVVEGVERERPRMASFRIKYTIEASA
jgi:hypothetical protein